MGLISIVIVLLVVGVLLWLIETQVPMDPSIKTIIRVVVIVVVVLWLVRIFLGGDIAVPHLR